MEGYLRAYIEKFKCKSLNTQEWKQFICQYFADKVQLWNQTQTIYKICS